jgi:hypothetical protein
MVLQRGRNVLIWGWADPGEPIVVSFAAQVRHAIGGRDGRWKVTLPPMNAGGPFLMSVRGKKTVLIKDVMMGEVWVLSGQSNMSFPLEAAEGAEAEIKTADYPQIRLFTVPQKIAFSPQQRVSSRWEICNPETVKEFSAVGYFFGRELYKKLGVPMGLIHSSWPGTQAENWATAQSLQQDPALAPILQHWRDKSAETRRVAGRAEDFELQFDDFELLPKNATGLGPVMFSNFDEGGSRNIFDGSWTYSWRTAPSTDFTLVRPGRGGSGYAARISGKLVGGPEHLCRHSFLLPWPRIFQIAYVPTYDFRLGRLRHYKFRSFSPMAAGDRMVQRLAARRLGRGGALYTRVIVRLCGADGANTRLFHTASFGPIRWYDRADRSLPHPRRGLVSG